MTDKHTIGRIGVYKCASAFEASDFVFREQPIEDYGIDAIIEAKENGSPTGKLIAIQIKAGESFFRETEGNSIVYRIDNKHYDYWINYTLPVIIVIYSFSRNECIWEVVNEHTLTRCQTQWKVLIPKNQTIMNSYSKLHNIAHTVCDNAAYSSVHISSDYETIRSHKNSASISTPAENARDFSGKLYRGQILDHKYQIIKPIASGGSGQIYKAIHLSLDRPVAIKVFSAPSYQDLYKMTTVMPDRLFSHIHDNEIEIMKQIKHPRLPQLYDVINIGPVMALVMEFVEGCNILQYVDDHGPISCTMAKDYIIQLCDTLEYLHNLTPPIIHCDIKPNNVMLSADKKSVTLLDLGLSRIVVKDENTRILGRTDGYSPPEFYSKNYFRQLKKTLYFWQCTSIAYPPNDGHLVIKKIDPTADIYSLGATFYYFLTGFHPSYCNTYFDLIPDLRIRQIIQQAMHEDPMQRYPNVRSFKKAITSLPVLYDVVLSFAEEDRDYVQQTAEILTKNNVQLFCDEVGSARSSDNDLYSTLNDVYTNRSRYCVPFISEQYQREMQIDPKRFSLLTPTLQAAQGYLLPARFDDTDMPELCNQSGYLDLRKITPHELAAIIIRKLKIG